MFLLLALLATEVGSACAQSAVGGMSRNTATERQQHGRLVIIGGGLSRTTESIYQAVLSGRHGSGPICVIPTAGTAAERAIASTVESFVQWGGPGAAAGIVISTANPGAAHDAAVVEQIRGCSGFYFTGGVQSRIVTVFRPHGENTPAYDAVMGRFREGAVVAGSSAGAAIMSDPMIAAGNPAAAIASGVRRGTAESDEDDDAADEPGILIAPGMGFFANAIVDQHFLARGRIGRLIAAVLDLDEYDLGFGIDENTALVVDAGSVYAAGASGVIVVDEREASRDARSATNLKLHLIGVGDRYDIDSRRVELSAPKSALPVTADSVAAPADLFARWSFLHVLHQFARSAERELVLPVPGGELVLRKGPDFAARTTGDEGVQGVPAGLTITDLRLDVKR